MAKEGVQIYRVVRMVIALWCIQFTIVFVIWLFDHWTTDLTETFTMKDTRTRVRLEYVRGSGFEVGLIPVYGLYDRFRWRLKSTVNDNPPVYTPVVSPRKFPFGHVDIELEFEEYRDSIVMYIKDSDDPDDSLEIPMRPEGME